jgi:excisionase family DNA binding protein
MMIQREFVTTREAAQYLGVSLRTVQLWVDSGVLEAWKTEGGHRRISAESVGKLVRAESKSVKAGGTPKPVGSDAVPAEVGLARLKVLVVDDDNILLKLYRTYITSWNLPIELATASNGYDALLLIGREQPDLMIVDLLMPGIDGFQMIRTLSASMFREGMEIIAISGMDNDAIQAHGGLPKDIEVIGKPVPFNALKLHIEKMLARRAEVVAAQRI